VQDPIPRFNDKELARVPIMIERENEPLPLDEVAELLPADVTQSVAGVVLNWPLPHDRQILEGHIAGTEALQNEDLPAALEAFRAVIERSFYVPSVVNLVSCLTINGSTTYAEAERLSGELLDVLDQIQAGRCGPNLGITEQPSIGQLEYYRSLVYYNDVTLYDEQSHHDRSDVLLMLQRSIDALERSGLGLPIQRSRRYLVKAAVLAELGRLEAAREAYQLGQAENPEGWTITAQAVAKEYPSFLALSENRKG
jgi:hypothetical protein